MQEVIRLFKQLTYFVNPAGERVPDIPHLHSLFLLWENDAEQVDEGDAVVQGFVITVPDLEYGEFASRTLSNLLRSVSALEGKDKPT